MGKLNEIQEQTTQSYGSNSFTTRIKENTVEFDSAKDKFTFLDPVEVPSINIGGTSSVVFTQEEKTKLSQITTPMQIQGRVDSVSDLPTENVAVGDTYLVGLSGSETFDEYVCVGLSGSPEAPVWESVGTTQVQADWNQNDSTKADYIKNRICYTENGVMESIYDDTVTGFTSVEQMGIYVNGAQVDVTSTMDIESFDGDNYVITVLGKSYEVEPQTYGTSLLYVYGDESDLADVDTNGLKMISIGIQVEMGTQTKTLTVGIACTQELTSTSVKIETLAEGEVHQLDDKYISDNIARVANLPTQVFITDETNGGIITNGVTGQSADEGNCILGNSSNASISGSSGSTIIGSSGSGPSNITGGTGNTVLGAGGSVTLTNSTHCLVSGTSNTQISNGTKCVAIGGGLKVETQGVQGAVRIGGYGGDGQAQLNSSGAFAIGGSGVGTVGTSDSSANSPGSGFIGHCGYGSKIQNSQHSIVVGGGDVVNITAGGEQCIINAIGDISSTGSYNTIIGTSRTSSSITGSAYGSAILGGSGNTINGTEYSVIIGGSGITATEDNTVYVPALNAINGVKTKKLTISSIDPTDVFMHSEIMDASSDVSFSRVVANASSSKTDGYVEILYKASSGVTCSAYIDSADVTLTADGAWHKLEQGCDPADGVEIHINNPSPVTDATLEVISKVYYI